MELMSFALSHNLPSSKKSTLYFLVTYIPPNPASSSFMKDLGNDPFPVQPWDYFIPGLQLEGCHVKDAEAEAPRSADPELLTLRK